MNALKELSQSSKMELLNTTYVLLLDTIDKAISEEDKRTYYIDYARDILRNLMETLNFKIELSKDLFRLYVYVQGLLINGYKHKEKLEEAHKLIMIIYDAYNEVDLKGQMVFNQNQSKVISGLTYGKGYLNDMIIHDNRNSFEA